LRIINHDSPDKFVMNRVERITQAYSQTPWRKQLQGIGMFLAILVIGGLIAIINLNVTARAATIGREIQDMQEKIEIMERSIADKRSQLAEITASERMWERSSEMDFSSMNPGEATYIVVEGYPGRQPANMAPPPMSSVEVVPVLEPDYSQSLLEWFIEQISIPALQPQSVIP
jgi:cell division protein FtsL